MNFKPHPFVALTALFVTLILQAPPVAATSNSTVKSLIEVRAASGETVSEKLAEKIKAIPSVSQVEKYLLIRGDKNDKIGVEVGAALRIFTKGEELITGKAAFGRAFRATDAGKNVALVNRVTYTAKAMANMVHYLGVGQTITLQGVRLRILGEVAAPTKRKIFLPLRTAQRLYDKEGIVTHMFVSVKGNDQIETVQRALRDAVGPAFRVIRH